MDREGLKEFFEDKTELMKEICVNKNHDYTGKNVSPFANFEKVERLGICSTEQGFLTRMSDKLSRVISFVEQGVLKVEDEKIEDTLIDLANYSLLMAAYLKSKKD